MIFLGIVIAVIVLYFVFRAGNTTGQTIGNVQASGGMRKKYAKLLEHITEGHKDSHIIYETKTYIRAGVENYGGSTIFHIQQCPNNEVMIDYDVSNNPVIPNFSLRFTFPDDLDQDEMMIRIVNGIQKKMQASR